MDLHTPRHNPRRLDFSSNPQLQPRLSNPFQAASPYAPPHYAPSPYTPSHRRTTSATVALTPQLIPQPSSAAAPDLVEEAKLYVAADLRDTLRNAAVDNITAFQDAYLPAPDDTRAADYLVTVSEALSEQLHRSHSLATTTTLRTQTRALVATLNAHLRLEYNTWLLVDAAWRRHSEPPTDLLTTRLQLSPEDAAILAATPGLTKLQHALAWLESTASDALTRAGGPQLQPLDDPAYRWDYTTTEHDGEPVPIDFPLRPPNQLVEVERKADARLARGVFRMIRAGRLEAAADLCRQAGQPWRAAALQGGRGLCSMAANGQRGLAARVWRSAAAAIAKSDNPALPMHERAVCAILAGILDPVLAVCDSHDDQAWARLTVRLDEAVQAVFEGATDIAVNDDTILATFAECNFAADDVDGIPPELLSGIRRVQAYIALGPSISPDHLTTLLRHLRELSEEAAARNVEWVARMCAQICLFLKLSGAVPEQTTSSEAIDEFNSALLCYVKLVVRTDHEEEHKAIIEGEILPPRPTVSAVAASFMAHVSAERQVVRTYGALLVAALRGDLLHEKLESERAGVASMKIEERRVLCLQTAEKYFSMSRLQEMLMDAVRTVWDGTFLELNPQPAPSRESMHFSNEASNMIAADKETEIIRSIELLVYPGFSNHKETLRCTNHAARRFFLSGNKDAARKVIIWFPREILDLVPEECIGLVREFKCWAAYMDAIAKYGEWHTFTGNSKPEPLPDAIRFKAQAPEQKVSFQEQSNAKMRLAEHEAAERDFQRAVNPLVKSATQALNDALLLGGGWMSGVEGYGTEGDSELSNMQEEARLIEVGNVRLEGTPQLAMLLHHILHRSDKYDEAIHLAVLVAGDDFKLYESFSPPDMRTFLAKVAESAVHEAERNVQVGKISYPYSGKFFEEIPSRGVAVANRMKFD